MSEEFLPAKQSYNFPFGTLIDECTTCDSSVSYFRDKTCDHSDWHVIDTKLSDKPCTTCTEVHAVILGFEDPRVSDEFVQHVYQLDIDFEVPNDLKELENP